MGSDSIAKKLGVKAGHHVLLLGGPDRLSSRVEADLAHLAEVKVARQLRPTPVDRVVLFCDRLTDLEDRIGKVTERIHPQSHIWVAYRPRRSDVTEDVVRRIGMTAGMVIQGKTTAIDDVWSAMRLVLRPENRDAVAYRLPDRSEERPLAGQLGNRRRTRRASTPPAFSGAGSTLATARARKRS